MSGGWNPDRQSDVSSRRQAALGRGDRRLCTPKTNDAFVAAGSAAGKMLLSECLADGAASGALDGKSASIPKCRDEAFAITPLWWVKKSKAKGIRRLSERRDRRRSAARGSRGLYRHRARQALHHDRHGDRPGQARQRQRHRDSRRGHRQIDRTGRDDDVSALLHAGRVSARFAGPFVGHHFQPVRKTPLHDWAARARCGLCRNRLVDAFRRGFPKTARTGWPAPTVKCATRAQRVGICDVSTLGKIDIQGKDAGAFLDRLYCNTFSTLARRHAPATA